MAEIQVIAPTVVQNTARLRVAAYCRVSSDSADQLNSFAAQVSYYTAYIQAHPDWAFVDIYADEGLSGTSAGKREEFLRLMGDCRAGKIDRILTKSVSRFARNVQDCMEAVRELRRLKVSVCFEKERLDTALMANEMLLSMMNAFAQEESLSISKNLKWAVRKRMQAGEFIAGSAPFGYRLEDGVLQPDPEEAPTVQEIFSRYLSGESPTEIARGLNHAGASRGRPGFRWGYSAIRYILSNEKYVGDSLLQKTYTANFLEGKTRKNNGELPQYYIKNNHPGIVSRGLFQQVQEEIARRKSKSPATQKAAKANRGRFTSKYALTEKLVCGGCGSSYRRVTWDIHGRKQVVWRCVNRLENGKNACPCSPSLPESKLQEAVMRAARKLLDGRLEGVVDALGAALAEDPTAALRQAIREKEDEFGQLLELAGEEENGLVDQQLEAVSQEAAALRARLQETVQGQSDAAKAAQEEGLLEVLREAQAEGLPYSDALVRRVVERITVLEDGAIRVRFIGGVEGIEGV